MLKDITVESMDVLTRMCRRKKEKNNASCISSGRDDQITTSAKLLDITYKSYGLCADLVETIN